MLEMQHDLNLIAEWMQFNKLTINDNKSKFMIVGSPNNLKRIDNKNILSLSLGNDKLQRVSMNTKGFQLTIRLVWRTLCLMCIKKPVKNFT